MKRKIDKNRPASMGVIPWRLMLAAVMLFGLTSMKSFGQIAPTDPLAVIEQYINDNPSEAIVHLYWAHPEDPAVLACIKTWVISQSPTLFPEYSAAELALMGAQAQALSSKIGSAYATDEANSLAAANLLDRDWLLANPGNTTGVSTNPIPFGTTGTSAIPVPLPAGKIPAEYPVMTTP